jgi:hypothetical protein
MTQRVSSVADAALAKILSEQAESLDSAKPDSKSHPTLRQSQRRFSEALQRGLQQLLTSQLKPFHGLKVQSQTRDLQVLREGTPTMNLRLTISEEAYSLTLGEDSSGELVEYFEPE